MEDKNRFIGRDGKTYTYAMVLGRMTLCEVMKPKSSKKTKAK